MARVSGCTSMILARKISQICMTSARVFDVALHAQEHEFAIHVFVVAEILHVDDVDQLVELLDDLLEHLVVAADDDGHAGGRGDQESGRRSAYRC